jgi:hypothetical protein
LKSNRVLSIGRLASENRTSHKKKNQQLGHRRSQSNKFKQVPHVYYPSALDDSDSSPAKVPRRHSSPTKLKSGSKSRTKSYFKVELPKQTMEHLFENENKPVIQQSFLSGAQTERTECKPLSVASVSSVWNSKLNTPLEKLYPYDIFLQDVKATTINTSNYVSAKENYDIARMNKVKKSLKLWEMKCEVNPPQAQNRGFIVSHPANPRLVLQKSGDYLFLSKIDSNTRSYSNLRPRDDIEHVLEKYKPAGLTHRNQSPNNLQSDLKCSKVRYRPRSVHKQQKSLSTRPASVLKIYSVK